MTEFADIGKHTIISLRKQNRGISDLVDSYRTLEPLASDYIASIHVLRICSESNLPFTVSEIKKYCKKIYTADMGGDPLEKGYFMTLIVFTKDCLKYSGKHQIKFKKVASIQKEPHKHTYGQDTNALQSKKEVQGVLNTDYCNKGEIQGK